MSPAEPHGFVFRAPWYVCARGGYDRFDARAASPALQKYDVPEFVARLVADPRDSLCFEPVDDVWSYHVPVALADRGPGRARFATHQVVRTRLRKLYQPSHQRYYAVVVELFCERPGLPRPQSAQGLEVGLVMRRRQVDMSAKPAVLRALTRKLTAGLLAAQGRSGPVGNVFMSETEDVLWADLAYREHFEQANAPLLDQVVVKEEVQGWVPRGTGGSWRPTGPTDGELLDGEEELPMWQLPSRSGDCAGDPPPPQRSLWFGLVPVTSGDHDDAGARKLDDHSVYELRTFVRRVPRPGREHCPAATWLSEPTEPFRLASFYDPEGTKNRRISLTLPDLRALAARAAGPSGPGGVAVTTPPGSQLSFPQNGEIPKSGSVGGTTPRVCTFALELFMIVAFFLFSLFLPIVVFAFQLWWLLALRFCLPPSVQAVLALKAFFTGSTTAAQMTQVERLSFDALLGPGTGDRLQAASDQFAASDLDDFVEVVAGPETTPAPVPPRPEPPAKDPLCGGG